MGHPALRKTPIARSALVLLKHYCTLEPMQKRQKVLVIVGPTSSGKSALAVELARKFNGEVISADSRQVYSGLDIGTGKITRREMKGIRHHLLDVSDPCRTFTAHDFVERAQLAIYDISQRGKLPIIAGGTGFYIDALVGRIAVPNVIPDLKLRARLEKKSAAQLYALLKKRDPRRARTIEPEHKRRLIRALEIVAALGKNPAPATIARYDMLWLGIAPPVKELEKKISLRLQTRMKRGMITEVKRLHASGLSYKRMEAFGLEYRSLARFLKNKITHRELLDEIGRGSRHYAKKQLAYWKRNSDIKWFKPAQMPRISGLVEKWLNRK